jgi:dephospho-CoA kinase
MNNNLIAVIGARKVGKTCASEILSTILPHYAHVCAWGYGIDSFLTLHGMKLEEFFAYSQKEENRQLLSVYLDHERLKNPTQFLKPLVDYINPLPGAIIEDIYYFNELQEFINMGARVLLITVDNVRRKERGYHPKMDNNLLESEVSAIKPDMVKNWKKTIVIANDKSINELRLNIQNSL